MFSLASDRNLGLEAGVCSVENILVTVPGTLGRASCNSVVKFCFINLNQSASSVRLRVVSRPSFVVVWKSVKVVRPQLIKKSTSSFLS